VENPYSPREPREPKPAYKLYRAVHMRRSGGSFLPPESPAIVSSFCLGLPHEPRYFVAIEERREVCFPEACKYGAIFIAIYAARKWSAIFIEMCVSLTVHMKRGGGGFLRRSPRRLWSAFASAFHMSRDPSWRLCEDEKYASLVAHKYSAFFISIYTACK